MKAIIRDSLGTLLLGVIIFITLQFTFQQIEVQQTSMIPNLEEGQRVFINKVYFHFQDPQRGDIIVFKEPESTSSIPLIKRVIGLPGETVEVKSGLVYVDGTPLREPYILDPPRYTFSPLTVPEGEYFVLGDNRNHSRDSHTGWTVPASSIMGKAWASIWPLDKWGLVTRYTYASD